MTAYRSSEAYNRWFCTTCGTHMVFEHIASGDISLATGTIEAESTDSIVEFKGHMWLSDSKDGGASEFIRSINNAAAERWLVEPQKSAQVPLGWCADSSDISEEAETSSLALHCHCQRVQLRVTRPGEASHSTTITRDWAHLLSQDRKRHLAGFCTCRSCRLGAGFELMSWSFIPLSDVHFPDGSAIRGADDGLESDERFGEMCKVFSSKTKEGVKRYFCPDCGACVIWFGPERPQLLDVATALLDAPSGVRAETLFEWYREWISSGEEAPHKGLLQGLEMGSRTWIKAKSADEISLPLSH